MKEQPVDDGNITIPLKELLWIILGDEQSGSPCNPIPPKTSEILAYKLRDSMVYKVDLESNKPRLWWLRDFNSAKDIRERQKAYSEAERIKRWILTANINMVAKYIVKKSGVSQNTAESMAYSLIKNPDGMTVLRYFFGVNKLKEKVEEIE